MAEPSRVWRALGTVALGSSECALGCGGDTHHEGARGGSAGTLMLDDHTAASGSSGQSAGSAGSGHSESSAGAGGAGPAGTSGAAGTPPDDAGPPATPEAGAVDAGPDPSGTLTLREPPPP